MDSIVGDARNSLAASSTDVPGTGWAHLRVHVPGDKCDCFPNDVNSKVDSKASLNPPVFSDPLDDNGLVQQLEREFDARDAVIDEYAMVPPEVINGASFVRPEAGKLAISSSLAEPLFKEASLVIKSWLKDESEGAVSSYSRESQALTLAATRALLLVSGDHCTAWNVRKRMVVWSRAANKSQSPAHLLVLLEHEVHLTALVFSVRPKATSAWAHRKWTCRLAAEAFATIAAGDAAAAAAAAAEGSGSTESTSKHSLNFDTSALVPPQAAAFWAREVDLCEALARKHPKNYFAWTHRLEVCRKHCTSAESLIAEAARAATFLARSPSDRAASHYNEQLLSLQLALIAVPSHAHLPPLPPSQAKTNSGESSPKGTASALTTAAVARAQGLCSTQPGHEALWQHLRVVATLRLSHAASPLCALRSSLRAATRLLPEENRLKSALAALLAEPSDDDLSVSNPEESDDDHDDDDAIGVLAELLQFAAHVMHGPPPAWAAVEQRRFAASFACFLCVHTAKALLPPPLPAGNTESESFTLSTMEKPSSQRSAVLGQQLAATAVTLCDQFEDTSEAPISAAASSDASEQASKCASNYSGAGSRHQCLWTALRRDLAQYL